MLCHIPPFPSIRPHQVAVHAFCHSAFLLCIFHSQLIHPSSFSCFPPAYPFVHISFLSSFVVPPSASQARLIIHPSTVFMDLVYLSTCLPSPPGVFMNLSILSCISTHPPACLPNRTPSSSPLLLPIIPQCYPSTYQAFISTDVFIL